MTVFGTFCRVFCPALVEAFRNRDELNSFKTPPNLIRESIIKAVMAFSSTPLTHLNDAPEVHFKEQDHAFLLFTETWTSFIIMPLQVTSLQSHRSIREFGFIERACSN
jgi:hypothetical protein